MDGQAIAAAALGFAGRRQLPTEIAGPRPAGTVERGRIAPETRTATAADEARTARATRP